MACDYCCSNSLWEFSLGRACLHCMQSRAFGSGVLTSSKHFCPGTYITAGIRKKLAAGSKCAGCKDLAPWVSPVCNHLWWCATASGGNGELLAAAWSSVTNHVCNIHTGHSPLYPRCLHKDVGDKQWIVPGLYHIIMLDLHRKS